MSDSTKAVYVRIVDGIEESLEFDTLESALLAATDDVIADRAEPVSVGLPGETALTPGEIREYASLRRNRGRVVLDP